MGEPNCLQKLHLNGQIHDLVTRKGEAARPAEGCELQVMILFTGVEFLQAGDSTLR